MALGTCQCVKLFVREQHELSTLSLFGKILITKSDNGVSALAAGPQKLQVKSNDLLPHLEFPDEREHVVLPCLYEMKV